MRTALLTSLAALLAAVLTLLGALPAFAQTETETETETETQTATATTTTAAETTTATATTTTSATSPTSTTSTTTGTTTTSPTTSTTTTQPTPTSPTQPTSTPTPGTTTPTTPTSPPPATSITNITVNVELCGACGDTVRYEPNHTFRIEGDTYNNTYVYTGSDGLVYGGSNLSCLDFDTQEDAQRVLNDLGYWAYMLDVDGNGVACEDRCGEFVKNTASKYGVRRGGQVSVWPSGSIDTGSAA